MHSICIPTPSYAALLQLERKIKNCENIQKPDVPMRTSLIEILLNSETLKFAEQVVPRTGVCCSLNNVSSISAIVRSS